MPLVQDNDLLLLTKKGAAVVSALVVKNARCYMNALVSCARKRLANRSRVGETRLSSYETRQVCIQTSLGKETDSISLKSQENPDRGEAVRQRDK